MSQAIFIVGAADSQPSSRLRCYAAAYCMVAMLCSSLLHGCNAMQQSTLWLQCYAAAYSVVATLCSSLVQNLCKEHKSQRRLRQVKYVYACSSQCEHSLLLIYTGLWK